MKHIMKKLVGFLSAATLSLIISVPCSAIEAKPIQPLNSFVGNFIDSEISAKIPKMTWSKDTVIAETIPTYDPNDILNGYIVNLKTKGNDSGYILVRKLDNNQFDIDEFGFDGQYAIAGQTVTRNSSLGQQKLIYVGNFDFLTLKSGRYIYLNDNRILQSTKSEINSVYTQFIANTVKYKQRVGLSLQASGTDWANVIYLWGSESGSPSVSDFTPTTMDDINSYLLAHGYGPIKNHCTPTAGMNMLKYWHERRGTPNLYYSGTSVFPNPFYRSFDVLANDMKFNTLNGTYFQNGFTGMGKYAQDQSIQDPSGNDYRENGNFDWAWIRSAINSNTPFILNAATSFYTGNSKDTGNHSTLVVGYQEQSGKTYLRYCDGWHNDLSHFFAYTYTNAKNMWYYRW